MQQSNFFENQIIQPSNLDFTNDSIAKNVSDVIVAFTRGNPGVAAGLEILGSGSAVATLTAGYGFLSNGERIELFTPSGITTLPYSGSTTVYGKLVEVNYNPNPAENPLGPLNTVSGLNAASLNYQAVEQYNLLDVTTVSGSTYVKIGDIITNFGLIESIDYSNRQNLKIGELDLFSNAINGEIITNNSIDSDSFVNPLHFDITLNSGVSIYNLGSGVSTIGTYSNPMGSVHAVSGTFHEINGFSPITIDSLVQKSGTSLESSQSTIYVKIDTSNRGTELGGGMVIKKNSIDLSGISNPLDGNLVITTNPSSNIDITTSSLNINAPVTIDSSLSVNSSMNVNGDITISNGNLLVPSFTVDNLTVNSSITTSGSTYFAQSVNVGGNTSVSGSLSFGTSSQLYDNLVANSDFSPSGSLVNSSGPVYVLSGNFIQASGGVFDAALPNDPLLWTTVAASGANYGFGPFSDNQITAGTYYGQGTWNANGVLFLSQEGQNVLHNAISGSSYTVEFSINTGKFNNYFSGPPNLNLGGLLLTEFGTTKFGIGRNPSPAFAAGQTTMGLFMGNDANVSVFSANVLPQNTWCVLAFQWDKVTGVRRIWKDGVFLTSDTTTTGWIPGPYGAAGNKTQLGGFALQSRGSLPSYGKTSTTLAQTFGFDGIISSVRVSNAYRTDAALSVYSGTTITPVVFETDANTILNFNFLDKSLYSATTDAVANNIVLRASGVNIANLTSAAESAFGSLWQSHVEDTLPAGSINVASGESNAPYWYKISGVNINSAGLYTHTEALNSLSPSTEYNISYFTKLVSGSATTGVPNNAVGVRAFLKSPTYTSTIFSGSALVGEWTRNSFAITTPSDIANIGLYINTYAASGSIISGTSVIGLASVQTSKGRAKLPIIEQRTPKIFNFNSMLLGTPYTVAASNARSIATNLYVAPSAIALSGTSISGSIISTGGFVSISASQNIFKVKNNTGLYYNMHYVKTNLILNGASVDYDIDENQIVSTSVTSDWRFRQNCLWNGYLSAGVHNIKLSTTIAGAGGLTMQSDMNGYGVLISNPSIKAMLL